MQRLLGVDVSRYQPPNLPWPLWYAFGIRFAYICYGLGYVSDHGAEKHREYARPAGLLTGGYWVIMDHDVETAHFDPVQSARAFVRMLRDDDELPPVVDVEALGVNAGLLMAFIKEFERLRPNLKLVIYTSAYVWGKLIGPEHWEFAKYPLWVAGYGIGGLQDPPRLPDIWQQYVGWQWRTKRGYLPGYANDLDINIWDLETVMPTLTEQLQTLIAEAGLAEEDLNVSASGVVAAKVKLADMRVRLAGLIPAAPPPPPPPPEHTLATLSNQLVINDFNRAFGAATYIAKIGTALTATQQATLFGNRTALYTGPSVERMPLSVDDRNKLIAALGA